jgi:hypothetical protein
MSVSPKEGTNEPKLGMNKSRLVKRTDEVAPGILEKFSDTINKVGAEFGKLKDAYTRPAVFTDSKRIIGEYTGALQEIDLTLSRIAREINLKVSKPRQEAMTNYLQAGGDLSLLAERAAKSRPEYRQGYEDAQHLTPEEHAVGQFIISQQEEFWQKAHDAGILEGFIENYVRGQWERENVAGQRITALANSGMLNDKPREAMKKVFQNYFEGEQLGFIPTDKRIGYQFIAAQRSIRGAIAARNALVDLMHSKEADGRPTVAVGGGGAMMGEGTEAKPYFVKPNVKPAEAQDYKLLDHPALRKWKWVGSDDAGKPIMMQGNMYLHPDFFGGPVKSMAKGLLGKSAIRSYTLPENMPFVGGTRPGDAMLRAGGFLKGTILIGPFHQFHLGEHAVFHKTNPLDAPEIDFDKRPVLRELVNHGLMLYNHNAMQEFSEGVSSGGLLHMIPVAGDQLKRYQEYLFQDYIPRLKAAMAEHAVDRAMEYYKDDLASGKFTRDQLLENVAAQSNAAFGEQNYKYIGRNPTYQDALRLALLAPDFLESRFKFFGQAVSPKGKEQAMALIRGAVIMSVIAQTTNALFGDQKTLDNPKDRWSAAAISDRLHFDKPFSAVIGGREYSPRSVVADMWHLVTDPRGFWYTRLNPLWGKPVYELASGRDQHDQKETLAEGAKNILKSWTPIPIQGAIKNSQGQTQLQGITSTLLQSIGVTNFQTKTAAEKKIGDITFGHRTLAGDTASQKKRYDNFMELKDDYVSGRLNSLDDVQKKAKASGMILSRSQILNIEMARDTSPAGKSAVLQARMKSFNGDEVMQVWEKMNDDEQKKYRAFIIGKVAKDKNMEPSVKDQAIKELVGKQQGVALP